MDFVVRRSKYDDSFSDLLKSLFKELEEEGQRAFVDFLYRIYSAEQAAINSSSYTVVPGSYTGVPSVIWIASITT